MCEWNFCPSVHPSGSSDLRFCVLLIIFFLSETWLCARMYDSQIFICRRKLKVILNQVIYQIRTLYGNSTPKMSNVGRSKTDNHKRCYLIRRLITFQVILNSIQILFSFKTKIKKCLWREKKKCWNKNVSLSANG